MPRTSHPPFRAWRSEPTQGSLRNGAPVRQPLYRDMVPLNRTLRWSRLLQHGETTQYIRVGPRDHFVNPSWHTARIKSAPGCVLFKPSDRPLHLAPGIHQAERLS